MELAAQMTIILTIVACSASPCLLVRVNGRVECRILRLFNIPIAHSPCIHTLDKALVVFTSLREAVSFLL